MHSLRLQAYAPGIATLEEDDREEAFDRPGSAGPDPEAEEEPDNPFGGGEDE